MSEYVWGEGQTQFFYDLSYEVVLSSVESLGIETTGRCLPLNSMENRVYEIEVSSDDRLVSNFIIAKFYRPGRWTEQQIQDEHDFLHDLKDAEVPVIAPIRYEGKSLFKTTEGEIFFSLFPKKGGRIPQEMNKEQLEITGRMLARIHSVGELRKSEHRLQITPDTFCKHNADYLIKADIIPSYLKDSYLNLTEQIYSLSKPLFEGIKTHRIHGDCHWGNIIWREGEGPYFIDFDDMLVGPAIQDIWLVVPGTEYQSLQDREVFLNAYQSMRDFDYRSLKLIEPLRTFRYIHFSAWISKRWEDPSFKSAFSHYGDANYWEIQTNDLREQLSKIQNSLETERLPWE